MHNLFTYMSIRALDLLDVSSVKSMMTHNKVTIDNLYWSICRETNHFIFFFAVFPELKCCSCKTKIILCFLWNVATGFWKKHSPQPFLPLHQPSVHLEILKFYGPCSCEVWFHIIGLCDACTCIFNQFTYWSGIFLSPIK